MKLIALSMIISAGVLYQLCAKNVPSTVNPFASLVTTYAIALTVALLLYFLTSKENLFTEIKNMNVASWLLGVVICCYELGFILAYRNGYQLNTLTPIANVAVMILLAVVGLFFYRETFKATQIVGLIFAMLGILITTI